MRLNGIMQNKFLGVWGVYLFFVRLQVVADELPMSEVNLGVFRPAAVVQDPAGRRQSHRLTPARIPRRCVWALAAHLIFLEMGCAPSSLSRKSRLA